MFFHPQLIQLDYFTGARQQGLLYFLRHLHKLKTTLCIKQNPDYFSGVISEVHRTTETTSPEELGWASTQLVTRSTFRCWNSPPAFLNSRNRRGCSGTVLWHNLWLSGRRRPPPIKQTIYDIIYHIWDSFTYLQFFAYSCYHSVGDTPWHCGRRAVPAGSCARRAVQLVGSKCRELSYKVC